MAVVPTKRVFIPHRESRQSCAARDSDFVKRPRAMKKIWRYLFRLVVLGVVAFVTAVYIVPMFVPLPQQLVEQKADPSTVVTDRYGHPLRRFLVNGEEVVSAYAKLDDIPQALIDATVAAEDKRYWDHNGIDYAAILRAARDALRHGRQVSGASTITQQLIKISSPPKARTLKTKIYEVFAARRLEMTHKKEWILENYLNRLPYGNMRTGCRTAARGYFGKPLKDLSLAECAFLSGLPNKPTRYNPYRNFKGAQTRQIWILDRMHEDEYITSEAWARAKHEKLVLVNEQAAFRAPHAVDLIVEQHRELLKPGQVRSTIDLELQTFAERAIASHLVYISGKKETSPYLHAAVVVIENQTGDILVLTGSRDYFNAHAGQINGAWTPRSPGSALKPFTYLQALEKGLPSTTVLADVPTDFMTSTGVYRPVNYDQTFRGPVRIRYALGNSLNIPAIRMLEQIGGAPILQQTLTDLGLTTLSESPETYGLGLTIGNAEVRLLELTNAYACLARLGLWKPYRILAAQPESEPKRLFSEDASYIIADMMSDPAARAQSFGWNNPLRFDRFRAAAKTGTSSDYRDAWTLGFTPDYTVGVWVGNFDNSSLDHFSGAAGAGPIFHAVLDRLHQEKLPQWYEEPDSVVEIQIDPATGHLLTPGLNLNEVETELSLRAHLPSEASPADYDEEGRALLTDNYRDWLASAPAAVQQRLAIRAANSEPRPFKIVSPPEGLVIYLDPDLVNGGRTLRLATDAPHPIQWTSSTLQINSENQTATLTPGNHQLTAEDPQTGLQRTVSISVEDT